MMYSGDNCAYTPVNIKSVVGKSFQGAGTNLLKYFYLFDSQDIPVVTYPRSRQLLAPEVGQPGIALSLQVIVINFTV